MIECGHALILLDGLDEISEVGQRKDIVYLVQNLIDKYIYASDFISPFDDKLFDVDNPLDNQIVETQPPYESGGNQIIVPSRIIGYQFSPLIGSFIEHCFLLLMEPREAKKVVQK